MKAAADQIWAYLHNELNHEQKTRFENTLAEDLTLQEALNEKRATHAQLEKALPLLQAETEPDFDEDALMAEWESEFPEHTEQARPSGNKIIRFSLPLAAAAAAAFVLFALQPNDIVQWESTSFGTTPQVRGSQAETSAYNRAEIKQAVEELQQAIETGIPGSAEKWILKVSLQEFAKGAMAIEISGYPKNSPAAEKIWSADYSGLEQLRADIPTFSKSVSNQIAEQTNQ